MPIKRIAYYVSLTALFLIPLFALFPTPFWPLDFSDSLFFPFITGKAFYFRILIEIAFGAYVLLAFMDAKYRPKLTPITIGVTLFALVAFLADVLGVNPLRSLWSNFERMEGWIVIIHLWALYIVSTNIFGHSASLGTNGSGRAIWHRLFNVELVVALFVACYGLFQLFGWAAIHQGSSRLDASLGNSAYMAIYMMINAFIAAYLFFVARARKIANAGFLQWAYPILAVLFSFIVLETQTRGTILGLLGGIMLSLFLYAVLGKKEPIRWRYVSGGIIALIVILVGLFWFNRTQPWIQQNPVLSRFTNISWNDASNQARQYIWPMAIQGAMQRPILGWGQENFNYIFNKDYNPKMWSQEQWFDRAHNVFLDWLVAAGILGLIAYIALYVLFLIGIWKHTPGSDRGSSLTIAEKSVFTGLLAAYFIHNIFVFDNIASYLLFFISLAFVNSLREGKPISWLGAKAVSRDAMEYIVAPITIVALVAVVYFFNVRPIEANVDLIYGLSSCQSQNPDASLLDKALRVNVYVANQEIREQTLSCAGSLITSQQVPGPTKQAFYELAGKAIDAQVAATPKDARIYVLAGSFWDRIGEYAKAVNLLETGHKLSPEKQTLDFELASAYVNTGKPDQAVALLKQTYESAPDYALAKSAYATSLVMDGKEADAKKMFDNDPVIFDTEQMAQAYIGVKEYSKAIVIYEDLVKANPTDINLTAHLAQIQYLAKDVEGSIATLRSLEKSHPELKDQIEAAIKQVQGGK